MPVTWQRMPAGDRALLCCLPGFQYMQQGEPDSRCFCPIKQATPAGVDWQPCIHYQTLQNFISPQACTNCFLTIAMTDSPEVQALQHWATAQQSTFLHCIASSSVSPTCWQWQAGLRTPSAAY